MRVAIPQPNLDAAGANEYAHVALANVQREYPTQAVYHLTGPGPLLPPRALHPSFYGSYDWHSCVEMHWVLIRLLRLFPALDRQREIREALDRHLGAEPLAAEARFFAEPERRAFERPYGWGWLLMLAEELRTAKGECLRTAH